MPKYQFPKDFLWGAATASYQIEGAVAEDGRKPSIWDTFCDRPGAVFQGQSGRIACDHYHRMEEDLDLMVRLGLKAYRFSVAWPRVIPDGTGAVNQAGLDFYDRLVNGLLARGIEPLLTLYHWDLPQVLEDRGGWRVRETAQAYAAYVDAVVRRLGDRVRIWTTFNEMWCSAELGYRRGENAPGARESESGVRQVIHHLLLAHGLGCQAIRAAAKRKPDVGIVHLAQSLVPFTERPEDVASARQTFHQRNGWYLDPIFRGCYPAEELAQLGPQAPQVAAGDLETIAQPLDYLGINVYWAPDVCRAGKGPRPVEPFFPRTEMGWPITPEAPYWSLRFAHELYQPRELYMTENGCAWPDNINAEGEVEDYARIQFLRGYLMGVHRAVEEGIPVRGYMLWSLLDNFEWAHGVSKRFGIVFTNYETQQRIPKMSAQWYSRLIEDGGF